MPAVIGSYGGLGNLFLSQKLWHYLLVQSIHQASHFLRLGALIQPFANKTTTMALQRTVTRIPSGGLRSVSSCLRASTPICSYNGSSRSMASVVPPVTQNAAGSKGPTAMVFLNMGGPSTTDEVGDFLSRLFVSKAQVWAQPVKTFCKS